MSIVLGTVVALYAMAVGFVFKRGTGSAAPARLSGDASVAHTLSCSADDVNISDSRPSSEDGAESELEAPPLASSVAASADQGQTLVHGRVHFRGSGIVSTPLGEKFGLSIVTKNVPKCTKTVTVSEMKSEPCVSDRSRIQPYIGPTILRWLRYYE